MPQKEFQLVQNKRRRTEQKENYNIKARVLPPLKAEDSVRMRLPGEQKWSLAKCVKQVAPRSYEVLCGNRRYRRDRRQLRKTAEQFPDTDRFLPEQFPASDRLAEREYQSYFTKPEQSIEIPKLNDISTRSSEDTKETVLRRSTRLRKPPDRFQA